MATFPALKPNGRSWTPGALTQSSFTHVGGAEVRVLLGSKRTGDVLRLSYENLLESEANSIISHYVGERTTFNVFDLPVEVYAGITDYSAITVAGNKWRYTKAPDVQYLSPDVQSVSVELIQVIGGISLRPIVGQFALTGFASTFSVTAGGPVDPNFSDVELLLHMDGANGSTTFTDSSSNGLTVTANGNAQIATAQSKFGGASGYFDGNGDYVRATLSSSFNPRTDSFTIEGWMRLDASYSTWSLACDTNDKIYMVAIGNTVYVGDGASNNITVAHGMSTGVWHHMAATFDGTTYRAFRDGTLLSSSTVLLASNSVSTIDVGGRPSQGQYTNGYIDDFRLTIGVARYTSNFTPPTAAFPDS